MSQRKIAALVAVIAILAAFGWDTALPTQAVTSLAYATGGMPPRPPDSAPQPAQPLDLPASSLALPPLKAVLLVGPIDGDYGDWTLKEVENMELAADVLEANGVSIARFYPGDGSTFADIEAAADGAHFLLYRGHGVYDGNLPYPEVGGFYLSSGFYLSDRIRSNLHLAENAIVMLYGCFTAGSSSAVGDTYDIGIQEASRRVAQYSDPFFDIGAAGYYANWFGDAFAKFLTYLFAGQTLGQAYESYFDFNPATVYRTLHPDHPALAMWLDKDNWDYWQYNNAFAGLPDQTLAELFASATLGGLPASLSFSVDVASDITIDPPAYSLTPLNTSGNLPIEWSVAVDADWLEVTPLSGTTPSSSFSVTPTTFDTSAPGEYTGTITITAESPEGTLNPVQVITVNLQVFAPQLGNLPEKVLFVYSQTDQRLSIEQYVLRPENTGSSLELDISMSIDSAYFTLDPTSGTTAQDYLLKPSGYASLPTGVYWDVLAVSASAEGLDAISLSPVTIQVGLEIIDTPFYQNYLSVIYKH